MTPCDKVRVLDLSQGHTAIVGMVLADYGADVVRVDRPGGGPCAGAPSSVQWNRGKRSVEIDLATETGRQAFNRLAADCDVVVENYRPGVAERLGFSYEKLAEANPRVVYLSVTGFGDQSTYSGYKAYEGIVAAKCGQFVLQNGYREGPIYDAVFKCSFGAAMLGLIGVLAALRVAGETGHGQRVSTSLTQANFVYSYAGIRGATPEVTSALSQAHGRDPHNVMPGYRIARCSDGKWIQSGSAGGDIFENIMRALGIDRYFVDPQFAEGPGRLSHEARDELLALIDAAYSSRPLDEWLTVFAEHDAAYGTFMTTQQFMDHPQVLHNGHVVEVEDPTLGAMRVIGPLVAIAGLGWRWPGPAPRAGEHSEAVLGGAPWRAERIPVGTTAGLPATPLEGVTILDLSMYAAAPGGPGLLADLGAHVIKIEPLSGDPLGAGAVGGGELFFRVNRGKDRISVDLKQPAGQRILHQLVADADVLLHNFRPGVPERLGADYNTVRALNDRIVHVYAASFGSSGPDAHRPAFDAVISAMAGGEVLQAGHGNPPQQRQTTDHSALLGVAVGILLGLRARDASGKSQRVETTMLAAAAYLFSDDFIAYDGKPDRQVPDTGQHGLGALYRLYRTAADGWIFLACPQPDEWGPLCDAMGHPEWRHDPRFDTAAQRMSHDSEIAALLEEAFEGRDAQTWEENLQARDVACVVATGTWPEFLFDAGQTLSSDLMTTFEAPSFGRIEQCGATVTLSATPGRVGAPQKRGESTRRILQDLGYDDVAIEDLVSRGVVG